MTRKTVQIDAEELLDLRELHARVGIAIQEAEDKAFDALARYKFEMFGYWGSKWVGLNRIEGLKRPNPFSDLVKLARGLQARKAITSAQIERLGEGQMSQPAS